MKAKKVIPPDPYADYVDFTCDCCKQETWNKPNKENLCRDCEYLLNEFEQDFNRREFLERSKNRKIMILIYRLRKAEDRIKNLENTVFANLPDHNNHS